MTIYEYPCYVLSAPSIPLPSCSLALICAHNGSLLRASCAHSTRGANLVPRHDTELDPSMCVSVCLRIRTHTHEASVHTHASRDRRVVAACAAGQPEHNGGGGNRCEGTQRGGFCGEGCDVWIGPTRSVWWQLCVEQMGSESKAKGYLAVRQRGPHLNPQITTSPPHHHPFISAQPHQHRIAPTHIYGQTHTRTHSMRTFNLHRSPSDAKCVLRNHRHPGPTPRPVHIASRSIAHAIAAAAKPRRTGERARSRWRVCVMHFPDPPTRPPGLHHHISATEAPLPSLPHLRRPVA